MGDSAVIISSIGKKIDKNNYEEDETFDYILDTYKKLLVWNEFDKLLGNFQNLNFLSPVKLILFLFSRIASFYWILFEED